MTSTEYLVDYFYIIYTQSFLVALELDLNIEQYFMAGRRQYSL